MWRQFNKTDLLRNVTCDKSSDDYDSKCLSISLYLCLSALSLPNLYPYYEMLPVTSPVTMDIPSVTSIQFNKLYCEILPVMSPVMIDIRSATIIKSTLLLWWEAML